MHTIKTGATWMSKSNLLFLNFALLQIEPRPSRFRLVWLATDPCRIHSELLDTDFAHPSHSTRRYKMNNLKCKLTLNCLTSCTRIEKKVYFAYSKQERLPWRTSFQEPQFLSAIRVSRQFLSACILLMPGLPSSTRIKSPWQPEVLSAKDGEHSHGRETFEDRK